MLFKKNSLGDIAGARTGDIAGAREPGFTGDIAGASYILWVEGGLWT
jgi:hypothetical protein